MEQTIQIFDTHAHYFDKRFSETYSNDADEILSQIMPKPVSRIVNVATNLENAKLAIEQAAKWDGMYCAIGIHPEDCHYIQDDESALENLEQFFSNEERRIENKIVAIGEIGLDYHYENYGDNLPMNKEKEKYYFEKQMQMAEKYRMPVIIHDREAHGDCYDMVLKHPNVKGIFHSYSGSCEIARELAKRDWFLSFSGTVTFKNAMKVKECVKAIPLDKILVETDAPYLAPHPLRGSCNHSGNIYYILSQMAEILNLPIEEVARITFENAQRCFGIS